MRLLPLLALVLTLGCKGGGDTAEPGDCELGCREVVLIPCRDLCDAECGADDRCRDACHGDCIDRTDDCILEECGG